MIDYAKLEEIKQIEQYIEEIEAQEEHLEPWEEQLETPEQQLDESETQGEQIEERSIQERVQEIIDQGKNDIIANFAKDPKSFRPRLIEMFEQWRKMDLTHETVCQLYECTLNSLETIMELPPSLSSKEIWRNGAEIGYSRYDISNQGRVRNSASKRCLVDGKNGNYVTFHLTNDYKKQSTEFAHRLAALLFIHNPDNKLTVDHINRIENDNRCCNLRWATHSEQNLNRKTPERRCHSVYQFDLNGEFVKKWDSATEAAIKVKISIFHLMHVCAKGDVCRNYRWCYDYLVEIDETEDWRPLHHEDHEPIEVSSKGRIRRPNGKIHTGRENNKYQEIQLRNLITNEYDHIKIHTLVATAFLGKHEDLEVNHKNGIKHDNRLENLEWVTHRENMIHAHRTGLISKPTMLTRAVLQIDPRNGNIISQYKGIAEASQRTCIPISSISVTCQGLQNLAGGWKWKFVNEDDNNVNKIKKKLIERGRKPVRQIDPKTGETIAEYPCIKIAAVETGIYHSGIASTCRCERKTAGGFIWEYV